MKLPICRFCGTDLIYTFVDLGSSPLSNAFLKSNQLQKKENFYPLHAFVCSKCFLVQLEEFESPDRIFLDYSYFSSFSDTWLKHAEEFVNSITSHYRFDNNSLVIEIASNDGYLLQFFKKRNIPILGIEPALNVAKIAKKKGITTLTKFFDVQTAEDLVQNKKQPDLLIANNVLAHVPELNNFVKGMKILLKPKGIITLEFPHLLQLIKQTQFDTIYHEHFSYFSLITLQKIFSSHGLTLFNVDELITHGGSLRIYLRHTENSEISISTNVTKLIHNEERFGLNKIATYTNFSNKVQEKKKKIREFFITAKNESKSIVGYGAAAKGNTLLNYCEINSSFIDYVVDRSPYKQGLFLPGTHIPVEDPVNVFETKPDYLLVLPWNLKKEIMEQMSFIHDWKGKFVTLIPEVKIYS